MSKYYVHVYEHDGETIRWPRDAVNSSLKLSWPIMYGGVKHLKPKYIIEVCGDIDAEGARVDDDAGIIHSTALTAGDMYARFLAWQHERRL